MLPPFNEAGLLPASPNGEPYPCTAAEVRAVFVDGLGAPAWRVELFEGWDLLRRGVAQLVPPARWWLWGCFISAHVEPLFGERETIQAVVLLPVPDLPATDHEIAMLVDFIGNAQDRHRVDATPIFERLPDHPDYLEAVDALEFKWRPRATMNVADHRTMELVPAGFVEVGP